MEAYSDEAEGLEPGQGQTSAQDMSHRPERWGEGGQTVTRAAHQPPNLVSHTAGVSSCRRSTTLETTQGLPSLPHSGGLKLPKVHHPGNYPGAGVVTCYF